MGFQGWALQIAFLREVVSKRDVGGLIDLALSHRWVVGIRLGDRNGIVGHFRMCG